VVAPLLWGAVAGLPGLAAYRAVNTLDAMVGYRSPRYLRFGWASARLDDVANWVPARVTAALTVACAPVTRMVPLPGTSAQSPPAEGRLGSGSATAALRAVLRDGGHHPSPNAGRCEAAFAGALGLRLGGINVYGGVAEVRPELGEGRSPEPDDICRAVRLSRAVTVAATGLAVLVSLASGRSWPASFPRRFAPQSRRRRALWLARGLGAADEEADQPDDQRRDRDPPQDVQRESGAGDDQDDQQSQQHEQHLGPPW
jgi:adenosylcobinamide-phosphate synthase